MIFLQKRLLQEVLVGRADTGIILSYENDI